MKQFFSNWFQLIAKARDEDAKLPNSGFNTYMAIMFGWMFCLYFALKGKK